MRVRDLGLMQADSPPEIDGLTHGDGSSSSLFITHYHSDHIGAIGRVLPGIPVYMGETARKIQLAKARRLAPYIEEEGSLLPRYEQIRSFTAPQPIIVGDIVVTPLFVDHSAFDSYMFVIETDGKRVLHTEDFRMHGVRSKTLPKVLSIYSKKY